MGIRGQRACIDCDHHWSYFETRSVTCPECGSYRSSSLTDESVLHTNHDPILNLTDTLAGIDQRPLQEVASAAESAAKDYWRARGYIEDGILLELDDVAVAVAELRHVAGMIRRSLAVTEEEERFFFALLGGVEAGERPETIPDSLRSARGLGGVDAIRAYRRDLSDWLDAHPHQDARRVLGILRDHEKRVRMLEGNVPSPLVDRLIQSARDLGRYLRRSEDIYLVQAENRLDRLA